ncbi:MAG TPA: hypothetical protein PKI32_08805, partial [Opitutales bacterium]|nr:hypothetical protein [Opitutales bacterium]
GGIVSDQSKSVTISAQGRHTVRFTYDKDDYQARNADSGSVRGISVFQTGGTETIPGNLDAGNNWRHSEWMGTYYNYPSSHWIFSLDLGFVYVNPITQSDWESRHDVWMYLNDPAFGWTWTDITNWPWCWSYTKGRMYYLSDGWFWVDNTQRFEQLGTGAVAYR